MALKEKVKGVTDYLQMLIPTRYYIKNRELSKAMSEELGEEHDQELDHTFGTIVEVARAVGAPGSMLLAKLEYGTPLVESIWPLAVIQYLTISGVGMLMMGVTRLAYRKQFTSNDNGLDDILSPNSNGA